MESGKAGSPVYVEQYGSDAEASVLEERKGSYVTENSSTNRNAYPDDGKYNGYWYRYDRQEYVQTNSAPSTPGAFTKPSSSTKLRGGDYAVLEFGPSSDPDGDTVTYEVQWSYNDGPWLKGANDDSNQTRRTVSIQQEPDYTQVQFRAAAYDNSGAKSSYRYSPVYDVIQNADPQITLSTSNGTTLYEGDVLTLSGQATDNDNGNVVSVKYQINNGTARAITSGISDGSTPISYNKQLSMSLAKLYDGQTAVSGELAEGTAHTLKVWSEDDQGGKSTVETRTFYVVPNRAPSVSLNQFSEKSELLNHEKITISGTTSDAEGNNVSVEYVLNDDSAVGVHEGAAGAFEFDIPLVNLEEGTNTLTVKVTDSYGFTSSKTVNVNKNLNETPVNSGVIRYEVLPPEGQAQSLVLWLQKELGDLNVNAHISMVNDGEVENYQPMNLSNSANINEVLTEDEFVYDAGSVKSSIMLKVEFRRDDPAADKAIKLISGVLD
ncbi:MULTISPECIES: Ig-like domain-containing protein [Pontibacillus]|uniref:Ig-like domain-containing protein n=1 Tax=Pontibacillus chungwhensis TaxID=265426 RepID=A0ABY8UZE3_9BACI|nr:MULTISPECIES: Ig-like domain-containing protein [Pontibacillus]MCD5324789.1 hypothetical protein [Pontibacillus sp. HN14]WIF98748.1 hypothetical protein QNI29_03595 [Pontibacillus chungwhensis]